MTIRISALILTKNKTTVIPLLTVIQHRTTATTVITSMLIGVGICLELNCLMRIERSGSGVELRTLVRENPGSNPVLR